MGQRFASSRCGAWLFSKTLHRLDDGVGRLSRGRHSVPGFFAGLPVVDVTTTGRRSGLPRTTHLIPIPIGDTLALVGTNFGQPSTPAWALNLEAEPRARVAFRSASREVVARPATEPETEQVMVTASAVYGGYSKYRQRITGRRVRIFVLDRC
jgi:deazaflavin-dependent oxidoreductase (nitroreductase family)